MELDGEHGAEEARRGDEEHGEKRDELEGGQVLRWKMGREAADLVSRIRQIAIDFGWGIGDGDEQFGVAGRGWGSVTTPQSQSGRRRRGVGGAEHRARVLDSRYGGRAAGRLRWCLSAVKPRRWSRSSFESLCTPIFKKLPLAWRLWAWC
ncbi:hypothetical protein PS2_034084 [Malus domestica]